MAGKISTINYGGAQIVFPIVLGQQRIGFRVRDFQVVNNTDSTLYISRLVTNPSATQSDATIPPRSSLGVFAWFSDQLYIGSSGATVLSTDSITLTLAEDAGGPFGASAIPITTSQIRRVQDLTFVFPAVAALPPYQLQQTAALTPISVPKAYIIDRGMRIDTTPNQPPEMVWLAVEITSAVLATATITYRNTNAAPTGQPFTVTAYATVVEFV